MTGIMIGERERIMKRIIQSLPAFSEVLIVVAIVAAGKFAVFANGYVQMVIEIEKENSNAEEYAKNNVLGGMSYEEMKSSFEVAKNANRIR